MEFEEDSFDLNIYWAGGCFLKTFFFRLPKCFSVFFCLNISKCFMAAFIIFCSSSIKVLKIHNSSVSFLSVFLCGRVMEFLPMQLSTTLVNMDCWKIDDHNILIRKSNKKPQSYLVHIILFSDR